MIEDFSALPLPFKTIAVDIAGGTAVPLERGILYRAMRSSMSIPIVFPPVPVDGDWLIDGAIVDNNPVDMALAWGADIIIDVDVGAFSPRTAEGIDSLETVTDQTIRLIQSTSSSFNTASGREDYRLVMDLGNFFWTDFAKFRELIDQGEKNARSVENMKALLALADRIAEARPLAARDWRREGVYRYISEPVFTRARLVSIGADGRVEPENVDMERISPRFIESLFDEFFGKPAVFDKLEMTVEIVRRRGNYESVGYHVEALEGGGYGLVLTGVRSQERKNDFSLVMDAAFSFGSVAELGIAEHVRLNFRNLFVSDSLLSFNVSYAFSRIQGPALSLAYTKKLSPAFSLRTEIDGLYYASSVHGYQPEGELSSFGLINTGLRFIYTPADFAAFHLMYHYEPLWYQNKDFNSAVQTTRTGLDYYGDLHLVKALFSYDTVKAKQPLSWSFLYNMAIGLYIGIPFAGSRYAENNFPWYESIEFNFRKSWSPRFYRNFVGDVAVASYRGNLESTWTLYNPAGKDGIPGYSGTSILGREKIILGLTYLEEIKPLSNRLSMRTFFALTLRSGNVWDSLDQWEGFKELRGGLRAGLQVETPIGTLFLGPECSFDGKAQFCVYYN
jgi:hypothetical protein